MVHDGIIPTIQGDLPEDGFARLWYGVVIDGDDLLGRFPVPDDGAPTVAYSPSPPEGKQRAAGGRPPIHKWKPFYDEVIRLLYIDRGQLTTGDLRRQMKQWTAFKMRTAPEERTIEREIDKILPPDLLPE